VNINKILQPEVQRFIRENIHSDLVQLVLSGSPFREINIQDIAQQIKGIKIAKKKFPTFLEHNIIFAPHINLEQTSSESTARFKSNIFSGEKFLDLTCGFGVDAFYISENFKDTYLVEKNKYLLYIVKYNFKIFNKTNVKYFNTDINAFLANNHQKFSLIYIDPSRRDLANRKKFLLEDLSPNILNLQTELPKHANRIAIKLSPLIDLSLLISQINNVLEIYIIAVRNEVKEILCIIDYEIEISKDEIRLKLYNLESNEPPMEIYFNDTKLYKPSFGEPQEFLYVPNNSLIKSGAFGYISEYYKLKKLHPNTHIFTSDELVENFPGRKLKIKQISTKDIKKGTKFNIISKNHPLCTEGIKKKYGVKDGGNKYLIFTQSKKGKIILESI